jgi:hypothetical protein
MENLGTGTYAVLVVLIIGLAYFALRRRRTRNPPDGHDR